VTADTILPALRKALSDGQVRFMPHGPVKPRILFEVRQKFEKYPGHSGLFTAFGLKFV